MFDVALLDLHNPKDGISIENKVVPENCERQSQTGDFLRYHYNGTLLDGIHSLIPGKQTTGSFTYQNILLNIVYSLSVLILS